MSTLFWKFFCFLGLLLLKLRYRIEVRGLENLTPEKLNRKQGILVMPNHPAYIDPVMICLLLWPKFQIRPLEIEYVYNTWWLKPLNSLVRAIPIPSFENSVNEYKVKKAEKAIREIADGLKKGDNFLIYPAGRLKTSAKELLGGASGAHELLKECPETNIVLIRTTGLWGSCFSRAVVKKAGDFSPIFKRVCTTLLRNFIFFTPRRQVLIEIEVNPPELPRTSPNRIELNRFLEGWYNRYPDEAGHICEREPLKLLTYSRLTGKLPKVHLISKRQQTGATGEDVSEETRRKVYNEIRRILDNPDLKLEPDMSLAFSLGMDSLNIAELITYLTKNFDVQDIHPEDLETVATVLEVAEEGKESQSHREFASTYTWSNEKNRLAPTLVLGRTVPEAFLNSCERMGNCAACGDDLVGVLNYPRIKKAVLVLAQHFKTWEGERVAVMLPASAGAYIAILALQFAGKTPVMLNWTLGSRYLEEMMKISGAKKIVTSLKFLDRLSNVQFGSCLTQLVPLEDIRKSLTLKMKLRGLWLTKCSHPYVLEVMGLNKIDENAPCVILFTSGTEAVPKGVPLSHKNIISNQRAALQCIDFSPKDVIYGILPPFHSFGFSVAGLLPLLSGMRVAFYPDPTDSFALAEGVHRWKVTLFCGAPAFLKGLLHAAKAEQLQTVRFFVSGAEKAPEELFQRVKKLSSNGKLIEGYGITECAPILTLTRPNLPPKGVGRLLPDIELLTIHPETLQLLPEGSDGEICVRGPNVFNGYLGNPRSPFIEINGEKWYRTGDLGHLDPDGSLILSGRLKRFTKIGGEMISLGAIEEGIAKALISKKRISPDLPSIALCVEEKEAGKPRLILFSIIPLDKEEANEILQQAGFSNLIKISLVKQIDNIPIMGAGKTDYRNLQSLC